MKSCWEILGIPPTGNKAEIKKAFAALVKLNPPSKDPAEYQKIREAYNEAMGSLKEYPYSTPQNFNNSTKDNIAEENKKDGETKKTSDASSETNPLNDHEDEPAPDEESEKIRRLREAVFNKGSVENLKYEAIKKERGKFLVIAIIFIPISLILLYKSQKNYGGMPCLLFNLLFGFAVATLVGNFDRKHSRTQKQDQQKISVGKEQVVGENVSVSLIFRFILTMVLCIIFKIIIIVGDIPTYMRHFFGGVLFCYFAFNLHWLKTLLSKK